MSSINPPCTVCTKTIYAEELLKTGVSDANGKPYAYHKTCFKCAHCGVMRDITSFAQEKGVIYCVQHYKEIFGRRGGYDDLFKGEVKDNSVVREAPSGGVIAKPCAQAQCDKTRIGGTGVNAIYCAAHANNSAPASTAPKKKFQLGGGPKCKVCDKSAYPAESIKTGVADYIYHRSCFKCSYCGTALTISKFSQSEGTLFCEEHFAQLCGRAGGYNVTHFKKDEEHADAVATNWGNHVVHK